MNSKFEGKTIVLTGTLDTMKRSEAKQLLKEAGARVTGSVSGNTDILIYGKNAGSKLSKAKKIGTQLMTEDEMIEILSEAEVDSELLDSTAEALPETAADIANDDFAAQFVSQANVDPSEIPEDLRALWSLEKRAGDDAFFKFPKYGELQLVSETPHHYVDSADGAAWEHLFEDMVWVAAEADGGFVGYDLFDTGTLDRVCYLDNEGQIRLTASRLVDHLAWIAGEGDHAALDAFCKEYDLEPPTSKDKRRANLPGEEEAQPGERLRKLLDSHAQEQDTLTEFVRPVDRNPVSCELADGRILIISSDDDANETEYQSQATFVFDSTTSTFSRVDDTPFKAFRNGATPGVFPDGRVPYLKVDEKVELALFSPDDGSWEIGPTLDERHPEGESVLLADGRLMVVLPWRTHIFDPVSEEWTEAAAPPTRRKDASAVLLTDGRVFLVGGKNFDFRSVSTCEIYDPEADEWSEAADLPWADLSDALLLLTDGRVLRTRGSEYWIYDPDVDAWSDPVEFPSSAGCCALLEDGRVAFFGHQEGAGIFDPASGEVRDTGIQLRRGREAVAHALPDGRVLLVGGDLYDNIASEPELWDSNTLESSPIPGFENEFEKQKKALARRG